MHSDDLPEVIRNYQESQKAFLFGGTTNPPQMGGKWGTEVERWRSEVVIVPGGIFPFLAASHLYRNLILTMTSRKITNGKTGPKCQNVRTVVRREALEIPRVKGARHTRVGPGDEGDRER